MPRTVRMRFGSRGPSPSFWRRCETCTSSDRSTLGSYWPPPSGPAAGKDGGRELFPRDRLARAAGEDHENPELERRELQLAPGERGRVSGHVERQVAHDDRPGRLGRLGHGRRRGCTRRKTARIRARSSRGLKGLGT